MIAHYRVYGLSVAADALVPGLVALPSPPPAIDMQFSLKKSAPPQIVSSAGRTRYASSTLDSRGSPSLTLWESHGGGYYSLVYADETKFWIDRAAKRLWAAWPSGYTLDDAATYLLGPVMGFVLRLRGIVCLHASAITIGEAAVALMGPPGAGKSTTAAAFARCGFPVLSDDIVALTETRGEFLVQPGYPRLCLWPDAATSLYGSPEALPTLTPNWEKRYVNLNGNGHRFCQRPTPLSAIYLLDGPLPGRSTPECEALSSAGTLMSLVANTYMNYLLEPAQRADEFAVLGRLASSVAMRRLILPARPTPPQQLCEAIVADFDLQKLVSSTKAT